MTLIKGALGCAMLIGAATAAIAQGAPQFSPDRIKSDVTFLSDDLLEGRNAGERGYDIAAHYVASRFAALGLQPAVAGGWYQQVPFQESKLGDAGSRLTVGGKTFANGNDILFGASQREPEQSFTAPVVFVGYGLDAPELGVNDYAGLDVRGKIVAVVSGFPKGMASDVGAHLSSDKYRTAEKHGAIGVLNILTPTALQVRSWTKRAAAANEAKLGWVETTGEAHELAPGIRAYATLNTPAAEALFAGARKPLSAVLAEAERNGGKPKGFALKTQATFERTSTARKLTSPNVLGVLPGSDPTLRNEYVVVMGHLDHDGVDPTLKGDKIYNGAMDNAAGVATMLEVARALAADPNRPKRSILFAAVTAEEDGLLGSEYLAKHPVVGDGKVVGVVNLDMPILLYDFTDVIAFGAEHSTLGPIVARAAGRDGVALMPDPMPEQGLFTRSDHYKFVREGIPSVALATGWSNGGKEIAGGFLANHYHQPSDEVKLPFNWQAGAKFARINYLIAREIANAPEAPRWYADSFFGKTFAKDAPKASR